MEAIVNKIANFDLEKKIFFFKPTIKKLSESILIG